MKRIALATLTLATLVAALLVPAPADAARRMVFEAEEVIGEPQRPSVSVVITRQNLNDPYDFELKESFLPKIVEALDSAPF